MERSEGSSPARRVLVVDDNADSAESLGLLIRVLGNDVRTALDAPSALEALRSFVPELAFLDLGLPGMSGYELAERIRRSPEGGRMRLVALTGWSEADAGDRARDAGFDRLVVKPMDVEVLKQILGEPRERTVPP